MSYHFISEVDTRIQFLLRLLTALKAWRLIGSTSCLFRFILSIGKKLQLRFVHRDLGCLTSYTLGVNHYGVYNECGQGHVVLSIFFLSLSACWEKDSSSLARNIQITIS
jgi:hypothetical protein